MRSALAVTGASVRAPEEPLKVPNLFNTLPELAVLADCALERQSWLDAYLFVAGMSQLIDDHLAPDPLSLRRVSSFLAKEGGSLGGLAARVTDQSANGLGRLVGIRPTAGRVRRLQRAVEAGLQQLSDLVADPEVALSEPSSLVELERCCERLSATRLPRALRGWHRPSASLLSQL